tara:strand:- start:160 stop:660 length:501 start_codon:yes stop_codon:yes gene_type:complete
MSKPGKVLRNLCKRLGVRLTVKRGKKRVYKSVKVLKAQCKRKKKKKVKRKRKRRFGVTSLQNLAAIEVSKHFTDSELEKAKYPIDIRRKVRNAALEKEIIPTAEKMWYRRQYKKLSPDIIRGSGRLRAHRARMYPGADMDTLVRYFIKLEKMGQMMEDDSDSDSGI